MLTVRPPRFYEEYLMDLIGARALIRVGTHPGGADAAATSRTRAAHRRIDEGSNCVNIKKTPWRWSRAKPRVAAARGDKVPLGQIIPQRFRSLNPDLSVFLGGKGCLSRLAGSGLRVGNFSAIKCFRIRVTDRSRRVRINRKKKATFRG